jgi:DNA-binding LacI/PurR family transcriptional regulator
VSYVKCDNHHGSYQAINHLIERGRKKIGFIAAVSTEQQAESRLQGYKDALKENGFEFNERLVKYCEQDKASIYNATLELLEGTEVDALFCLYDYMALPVMRAIASKGLSIPNDISIIGYDNIPIDSFLPITLSSVNTFSEEIGRKAAKLLLKHIKDPSLPIQQIILRPEVVVREST